jgi:hypothetical protein
MYLNHYPQSMRKERTIFVTDSPAYGMTDAEGMIASVVQGYTDSCTIEDAQRVLETLEDGEALTALGFTDTDQVWIETLHADIKAAMQL